MACDVNTNAQTMGWMFDKYSAMVGYTEPAIVTGKPIDAGGCYGREDATGQGCFITIQEALAYLREHEDGIPESPSKTSCAIQGFGNVGSSIAKFLFRNGYKVVAISDISGAIYNSEGLDVEDILNTTKGARINTYTKAKAIDPDSLLTLPVTIIIPAAMEGVITKRNAPFIQARVIAEGANGPTTPEADPILEEKKIFIIPDILANAGGVAVSYFEWVQNVGRYIWTEDEVRKQLKIKMSKAFNEVIATKERCNVSMRTAAFMTGLNRVVQAGIRRGKGI